MLGCVGDEVEVDGKRFLVIPSPELQAPFLGRVREGGGTSE